MGFEIDFCEDNFKLYYHNQFASDLAIFLRDYRLGAGEKDTLCMDDDGVLFYPWAETTNPYIKTSDTDEHICYFAVCLIYSHLFVYEMNKKNRELARSFCRCTGYPWINCGLGGMMHPYQVALEMRLLPHDLESLKSLQKCILDAASFMKTEMMPFLEGKQDVPNKSEYKKVVDGMKDGLDDFWDSVLNDLGTEDLYTKYSPDHQTIREEFTPRLEEYHREHNPFKFLI